MPGKTWKDMRLLSFVLLCFVTFLVSCSTTQECYEPVNVNVVTGFKLISVDSVDSPISIQGLDTIKIKVARTNYTDTNLPAAQMRVIGEDKEFIIGSAGRTIGPLLNPAKDTIRYRFQMDTATGVFDTITFYYTPTVHFISNNCGYTYYFNLQRLKSTYNTIDSVALINADVSNGSSSNNVQLYFKK